MTARDQPGHDWTVVLRRRRARIVEGQPQGGAAGAFEVICCYCGDHPYLDYREVSPELQHIRGPTRSRRALPPSRSTSGCTRRRFTSRPASTRESTPLIPGPHLNRNVRAAKASPESRTVVWGNA
jgi:hypothetical protein